VSQALTQLQAADLVFWDFDGVIKDSVAVKTVGYEQLFLPFGPALASRVRQHHEAHGGVSRYEKIRLYLDWAGEPVTQARVDEFCARFSQLVLQAVIDSPWVPGVREYLQEHRTRQHFVLITATPKDEIDQILRLLDLAACFRSVFGSPTPKAVAIREVLTLSRASPDGALVVGDSETDLDAALANGVGFLLRRTTLNQKLQERHPAPAFDTLRES